MKHLTLMGIGAVTCLFSCKQIIKTNSCTVPVQVTESHDKSNLSILLHKDTSGMDCEIYSSVNTYLKENLKDYSSYQPVSFAEFEVVKPKKADQISEYLSSVGYYDGKNRTKHNDSLFNEWTKFRPDGYIIKHKYRSKNGYGAYGLETDEFDLDTNFKVKYATQSQYREDKLQDFNRRMKELNIQ
jgi:hypothetical protein